MPLHVTPDQARTVIELSEGVAGPTGGMVGHTKRQHVSISKAGLAERMEQPDPHNRSAGKSFWRAAFLDIQGCAALLSRTVVALGAHPFVRDFATRPDGDVLRVMEEPPHVFLGEFDCRDVRGRAKAHHVRLILQKARGRPHDLHLVTFYPYIPLPEDW